VRLITENVFVRTRFGYTHLQQLRVRSLLGHCTPFSTSLVIRHRPQAGSFNKEFTPLPYTTQHPLFYFLWCKHTWLKNKNTYDFKNDVRHWILLLLTMETLVVLKKIEPTFKSHKSSHLHLYSAFNKGLFQSSFTAIIGKDKFRKTWSNIFM